MVLQDFLASERGLEIYVAVVLLIIVVIVVVVVVVVVVIVVVVVVVVAVVVVVVVVVIVVVIHLEDMNHYIISNLCCTIFLKESAIHHAFLIQC